MITIGDVIGTKYKIDSFIGSGGMAQVYKAHNTSTGKVVAVKILKDEFQNDAEFVRRFEREARAGLTLSHNNIVHSLDVGQDKGMHYIVFEFINGKTLKEYIHERGKLPLKTAINITTQILDALSHAHEHGIIHRDVKPQNVMITEQGVAKLADFGIARDAAASTKTFTGSDVLGSVHYISPEQARGNSVTQQSDLYSVAIMLYEMLTGTVPFDSENSVSVALKHLSEDIQPPIELNRSISPALNDVILKAASKDLSVRYATAGEMKRDLIKALNQPNGRFARQKKEPEKRSEHRQSESKFNKFNIFKKENGSVNILAILGGILGVFLLAFLIVTLSYNSTHIYVPDLLGDTYEEAIEKVGDDFSVVIVSRVQSDKYLTSGHIIKQEPASGSRADSGTTIRVTVSIDSENVIVPELTGKNLLEASNAVSKAGLKLAGVEYADNSAVSPGRVYDQEPKPNQEVGRGSEVTLYISGEAPETEHMPNVIGKELDTAVSTLRSFGFEHILVRYEASDDKTLINKVFDQNMSPGVELDKQMMVILSVYGELTGAYSADRAYNVSITEADTPVMATVKIDDSYEVIVYEAVMPEGTQTASFTAHANAEGTYTCILYINGVEDKREEVRFSFDD